MAVTTQPAENGASISFRQPVIPGAPLTESSYFRLGAYTADGTTGRSEKLLIPMLSATTSAVSSHHGVLFYTNQDLQENVLGTASMTYGQGHTVEVAHGNASYRVNKGRYDLSAQRGVLITAGETDANGHIVTSADIVITTKGDLIQSSASDFVRTTEGQKFDLVTLSTSQMYREGSILFHYGANISVAAATVCITVGSGQRIAAGLSTDMVFGRHLTWRRGPSIHLALVGQHKVYRHSLEVSTSNSKIEKIVGSKKLNSRRSIMFEVGGKSNLKALLYGEDSKYMIERNSKSTFDSIGFIYNSSPKARYSLTLGKFVENSGSKYSKFVNFMHEVSGPNSDTYGTMLSSGDLSDVASERSILY